MTKLSLLGFLVVAVVFHSIYIYSIFDIYFVSPIVHGMQKYSSIEANTAPPAKRLFLIVGDGLRADKCFESHPPPYPTPGQDLTPRPLAPFLRSKILREGTFGVSHTRVPTESRPGHVALIAGLYEDVSAVTTGWKDNPVDFDSVFNQSRHTWSWGSPDILPMFKDGATPGRVDAYTYSSELEDFTASDATLLDTWVFDRVGQLFHDAKNDQSLGARLRQDRNVFFLHLLGIDMNGHSYRPYSSEYLNNIAVVDKGIEAVVEQVERFYGDDQTAWVFTADHGMSDWGSHGDGHPNNTRTPLVAWGAGIHKPRHDSVGSDGYPDGFSKDWGFGTIKRNDVNQADIATLMAYLVGLNYPSNSVGQLPLSYLSANDETKSKAMLANAHQILETYLVREVRKSMATLNFQPFNPFVVDPLELRFQRIADKIQKQKYADAIAECTELMDLGLEGLRYYQTYDWLSLRTIVTCGYLGWIAFALTNVIHLHVLNTTAETPRTIIGLAFFSGGLLSLFGLFAYQNSPWTYYSYAIFPFAFWEEVWVSRKVTRQGLVKLFEGKGNLRSVVSICIQSVFALGFLEAIVYGYFERWIFTAIFLCAIWWPVFYGQRFIMSNMTIIAAWLVCCVSMSTFTVLPVIKQENPTLISAAGIAMATIGIVYMAFAENIVDIESEAFDYLSKSIMGLQVGLIVLTTIVTNRTIQSLQAKTGLPAGNQMVGWLVLALSLCVPLLHKLRPQKHFSHRLMIVFLAFSPTFVLLTISYEGLFYVAFSATLVVWVQLERRIYEHTILSRPTKQASTDGIRRLQLSDTRVAFFFFFTIQAAFFGTGNVASLSSFSLDSVYRLIPIFDPFAMGAILMFKLLIPFALISANLGVLNRQLEVAPSALFMLVMAVCDVLTLNFFFMVKDEGSWLDIGTTISHFCIASLLSVFVAALEFLSEAFVSGVEVDDRRIGRVSGSTDGVSKAGIENGHRKPSLSPGTPVISSGTRSIGRNSRRRR